MEKISIIIPAYNEEKRISETLEEYSKFFEDIRIRKILEYEILVVINNTVDRTEEIVGAFSRKNRNILYINLPEAGKGNAVMEGFRNSLRRNNQLIGFVDADMATRPEDFFDLVNRLGSNDGVIASRYVRGAIINPKPTIRRLIAKKMFNILVRSFLFLPYRDTQCGAKIFRREALKKSIPLVTMSHWAFDVDLLYSMKKKGFILKEIPTKWSDQKYSKIDFWKAGPRMALGVIRLRLLNSPFRDLIRSYDVWVRVINELIW